MCFDISVFCICFYCADSTFLVFWTSVVRVCMCWTSLPCFTRHFDLHRYIFVAFITSSMAACCLLLLCCCDVVLLLLLLQLYRCGSTTHTVHVVALFTCTSFSLLFLYVTISIVTCFSCFLFYICCCRCVLFFVCGIVVFLCCSCSCCCPSFALLP